MKVLNNFNFSKKGGGRKSKYNWQEMTDGNVRIAVRGEDYSGKDESFMNSLYAYARKNNLAVTCQKVVEENGVVFQFKNKDE